jgi:hypothetical protein
MPMITIKFDSKKVTDDEVVALSSAIQKIVSNTTGIQDVFVYADSPKISTAISPIEIFVEMSASKIENLEELFASVKEKLKEWKNENDFQIPINLTIIPMNWKFEVNI